MKTIMLVLIFFFVTDASWSQINNGVSDSIKANTENKNQAVDKIFTCSMHPEIRWSKPDVCPKCGMDLILAEENSKSSEHKMDMQNMMNSPWMYFVMGSMILVMILFKVLK